MALTDLGDIDAALPEYEKLVAVAARNGTTNVTVDACINAGLTLAKLKQGRESAAWFTRAITLDPDDAHGLHWKAFCNMAISRSENGEHLSAAICAMSAYLANPQQVDTRMVTEFLNEAGNEESARVLELDKQLPKVEARSEPSQLEAVGNLPNLDAAVSQLLVDAAGQRVLAIAPGQSKVFVIDSLRENIVTELDAPGSVLAAATAGSKLYLSVREVGIVEMDVSAAKVVRTWPLKGAAPTSLAAFPAKAMVVFPASGLLNVLDLETGKLTATAYYCNAVASDHRQEFCYSFVRREAGSTTGHVIVNGRPIIIQQSTTDWLQTTLMKFAIVNKRVLLAELRMNAASNGRQLHVSPEGDWAAAGGGRSSRKGITPDMAWRSWRLPI